MNEFKSINDTHGHAAGDAVLRATARQLTACVRAEDTVARVGGDEFIVVAELSHASELDSLRARLEGCVATPVSVDGRELTPSATVGAVLARDGESGSEALARADAAMYERKRGRGR